MEGFKVVFERHLKENRWEMTDEMRYFMDYIVFPSVEEYVGGISDGVDRNRLAIDCMKLLLNVDHRIADYGKIAKSSYQMADLMILESNKE